MLDAVRLLSFCEPLAFVAAVLVCIWVFPNRMVIPIGILVVWTGLSWLVHGHTVASLGFSVRALLRCVARWRLLFLLLVVLWVVIEAWTLGSVLTWWHAGRYLVWCVIQQAVYQSMVFLPFHRICGRPSLVALIAGVLFALVHLPNPVLVPTTFVWGLCSSLLFARYPSVLGLAVLQVLLSAIGVAVLPLALHHGFRVGPFY